MTTAMYRLFKQSVANPMLMTDARRGYFFAVLCAYSATAGALLGNEDLLESEWWERGELYRLFSPLAFVLEFMTHPLGGRYLVKFWGERAKRGLEVENSKDYAIRHYGFCMERLIDCVLKPVMIANRLLTSGHLATQENPDITLLEKSVLKQDMVVSTVMGICKEVGNGVTEGYLVIGSQPWQEFIDVSQMFKNGVSFESFVSACGDAAIRIEGQSSLTLIITTSLYLEKLIMEECSATNGQETTSRATTGTGSNISKSQVERILEFLLLWSLILLSGLENARKERNIYVEAANSDDPNNSSTSDTSNLDQETYRQFVLQLRSNRCRECLENAVRVCLAGRRSVENKPSEEDAIAAASAACLATLLMSARTFILDDEVPPLSPILQETTSVAMNYVSLVRLINDFIQAYPQDYLNRLPMDKLKLLSKVFIACFDGPARVLVEFDTEIEKDPNLLVTVFETVQHLLAMHAKVQYTDGLVPESLKFLLEPMDYASTYIDNLWTWVMGMPDPTMSNHIEVPVEVNTRILAAGSRAVQTACKVALLGLTSPGFSDVFDIQQETLSAEQLDSLGLVKLLHWHIAMPQLAWSSCVSYCIHQTEILQVLEFAQVRSALLLQVLQVMSHVTDEMEAQLKVIANSPLSRNSYFISTWSVCRNMLRDVVVWPDPGLERVLSFVKAVAEIDASDELLDTVRELTNFVENREIICTQDDFQNFILVKRVKALSHLQCANLECTTIFCSRWEKKKSMVCSGCKCVRYCSEKCQKIDWRAHKRACRLIAAEGN